MTEHRYALVNRPAMWGAVPDGYIRVDPRPAPGEEHHDFARHGIIVYPQPLPDDEMTWYELRPLIDGDERRALVERIAESFDAGEREAIHWIAAEDLDDAREVIYGEIDRLRPVPSIGDPAAFADAVIERMR